MDLNIFVLLLTGHLLGDFLFQPNWLARLKEKRKLGLFLHSVVITIATLVFTFPYLNGLENVLLLVVYGGLHGFQDQHKINYIHKEHDNSLRPFLYDQLIHLVTIIIFTYLLSVNKEPLYATTVIQNIFTNTWLMTFVALSVFSTYALDIMLFLANGKGRHRTKGYKRQYKKMLVRFVISSTIFAGLYLIFGA